MRAEQKRALPLSGEKKVRNNEEEEKGRLLGGSIVREKIDFAPRKIADAAFALSAAFAAYIQRSRRDRSVKNDSQCATKQTWSGG